MFNQTRYQMCRATVAARPSAEAELDRLAKEMQRRESGVSYSLAYCRVLEQNPALYRQYLDERKSHQSEAHG
jgi:hypothetical protein